MLFISACGAPASEEEPPPEDLQVATVSLSPVLTALLAPAKGQVLTGKLVAARSGTSISETIEGSFTVDDETLDMVSDISVNLIPGNYEFSLLVSLGDQQYAGLAQQEIVEGDNTVPMTIRPVVGDQVLDVNLVSLLTSFIFNLGDAAEELLSFAEPRIGIIIDADPEDNNPEQSIFDIDKTDGFTNLGNPEDMFANLSPDVPHTIRVIIYNGEDQTAQSEPQSETIPGPIEDPVDIEIIINPTAITGVTQLDVGTGEAHFKFIIAHEAVEEAGGDPANLKVVLTVTGDAAPAGLVDIFPTAVLDPASARGDFKTEKTIAGFQFGDVDLMLTFSEISSGDKLGDCMFQVSITLSSLESSGECQLALRRRAVISGKLKAVMGINVLDEQGAPLAGAIIIDVATGRRIGITGGFLADGTVDPDFFGTEGYVLLFHDAGENLVFRAEAAGMFGENAITLTPLLPANLDIVINQALP